MAPGQSGGTHVGRLTNRKFSDGFQWELDTIKWVAGTRKKAVETGGSYRKLGSNSSICGHNGQPGSLWMETRGRTYDTRNQRSAARFVGSGSPTATQYLYSEMNLDECVQQCSQRAESNDPLGNHLAHGGRVLKLFVKSNKPSGLHDSDLPAPFETRASSLYGSVGAGVPFPIGTHEENIAAGDHSAIVHSI